MLTISQAVEKIIKVKPFVIESLSEGLLNISSLARSILPDVARLTGRDVKQGAIVMALKRMVPDTSELASPLFNGMMNNLGDIIVRSNLTDYTFRNSSTIMKCHIQLISDISSHADAFYTMVRGVFESNLVVDSDVSPLVEKHFAHEVCTFRNANLSAITLKLPAGNVQAVGFYYQILKLIAWEGINVKEVVSTTNEFSLIVADEDVDRAFSILKRLKTQ
ncbi:MAG: aspartate kinase [Bacteroidales bacterium]|jgi:hypothetical protein|nr:aspartate kinase [Bacteroidales bacterium]MBP5418270.1 aspartate kinase [Bacteroidales bacterium]MCR5697014.1 hypothetical protein [Marinilabiliaceae bacterium]